MTVLSYEHHPLKPASRSLHMVGRALTGSWRRVRPLMLIALPIVLVVGALGLAGLGFRVEAQKYTAAELRRGRDVAVPIGASSGLLLARVQFLLAHDRVEEVQPYVEALDRSGTNDARAVAHYNFANGRLRQAFDEVTASRLDKAGPFVVLARQEYRRALTLEPEMWDAKFNLDVASRLVRDFPEFERTMGDEVKTKKKLWTDVPGKPEGLP